jgi:glutamyl-tRNA reductase
MEGLATFTVCSWPVASMEAGRIAAIRDLARSHATPHISLATCQRIEVYQAGTCDCSAPGRLQGRQALLHLAEVAAGLHAAVLGETQVLGQVRDTVTGASGTLRRLADLAIAAARDLRREAHFTADTSQSLERALALANVQPQGRILVLGAGHLGKAIARRAARMGFAEVVVAVRDTSARALPPGADCLVALAEAGSLGSFEVVVGCLGDRNGAFNLGPLPVAKLYVDLGTPANFPPGLPNVVTIARILADESGALVQRRAALRDRLAEFVDRRLAAARHTSSSPAGRLRREIEAIRAREAAAIRQLHPDIPMQTVEAITQRIVNQIFHLPSARLKETVDLEFSGRVVALFSEEPGPVP